MVELKLVNSTSPMLFTSPNYELVVMPMFAGESQKPKGETQTAEPVKAEASQPTEPEAETAEGETAETASAEEETSSGSNVQIAYIFYDGVVPSTESDEYVEITNLSDSSQDLEGWVLRDISEGYPSFTFPSYVLTPGAKTRVYTNEVHPDWGGFSFGYGKAIWNNTDPDWAALYSAQGDEVSRKSY